MNSVFVQIKNGSEELTINDPLITAYLLTAYRGANTRLATDNGIIYLFPNSRQIRSLIYEYFAGSQTIQSRTLMQTYQNLLDDQDAYTTSEMVP